MRHVMVRYKVQPARAAENEELVRAVYAQLHETRPAGLRYATFQLDDGVTFVHVATHDDEHGSRPLTDLAAFQAFQEHLGDRCEERPVLTEVREVGSYHSS